MNRFFQQMAGGGPGGAGGGGRAGQVIQPGSFPDHTGLAVFGTLMHFAGLILVLAALVWIVHAFVRGWTARSAPRHNAALEQLDLLYAQGQVKRDDYLARRADLLQAGP